MSDRQRVMIFLELGLWLTLAAVAFALTFDFSGERGTYAWGPASWPRAIIVIMILGALVHCAEQVRVLKGQQSRDEVPEETERESPRQWLTVLGLFGLPLLYVLLMPFMGFYVSTPLFLIALLLYLGERRLPYLLGVPLFIFVIINLAFTKLFYVALPTGTWPGFYDFSNWFLVWIR